MDEHGHGHGHGRGCGHHDGSSHNHDPPWIEPYRYGTEEETESFN